VKTPSSSFIELSDVHKVYKTAAGDFPALCGIDLSFERGEFTAIMGKSGSGKSTLINMITGIDHPTSGIVRIGEHNLNSMKEGAMAEWRGRNLGIVFQFFQLLPTLTVLENILLAMDYAKVIAPAERVARAESILAQVGLEGLADALPASLSGGEQQIAAIARALANDPPILIADEPTGNLDSRSASLVLNLFEELAAQGKTILLVTHDPTLVRRARRRILISDGELVHEAVYHAFPMLPHTQLLHLSKIATPRSYSEGETIIRSGSWTDGLMILLQGKIQIAQLEKGSAPKVLSMLGPGDSFTQLELSQQSARCLSLRALEQTETLCIPMDRFREYIKMNPASETLLDHAATQHIQKYELVGAREPIPA
jgi:putative ABC transport system ATP-binding protein